MAPDYSALWFYSRTQQGGTFRTMYDLKAGRGSGLKIMKTSHVGAIRVHTYVYLDVYIISIYIYIHVRMCMYICTCVNVCTYAYMYLYRCAFQHICTYMYTKILKPAVLRCQGRTDSQLPGIRPCRRRKQGDATPTVTQRTHQTQSPGRIQETEPPNYGA